MDEIVLIGGGGHAKSVADSIETNGKFKIIGYTDYSDHTCNLPYLGTDEKLKELFLQGIRFATICVGFLGKSDVRDRLYHLAKTIGYSLPPIIDPSAIVSKKSIIGEGTFVGKGACVNADAQIGKMCIINSCSIIEHNNIIQDFTHVAVGATLCGDVLVGDHVLIGANSTIIQGLSIGANSIVGAGSIIRHDVSENRKVYGVV